MSLSLRSHRSSWKESLALQVFAHRQPRLPFDERPNLAQSALSIEVIRWLNRFLALTDVNPNPIVAADPRFVKRARRAVANAVESMPDGLRDREERRLYARLTRVVADRYGPSNQRLAELTGEDLAVYGYPVEGPASPSMP